MRPIVGITTYVASATFESWTEESALVPADYVRAIELAGGRPLLVPPSDDGVDETLDVLDALVFSGGSDLEPETRLAALLGDHAPVKSHHHQGFGRLGSGLREAARAEDGTVEALEDPSRRFALGVLWHPEAGEDMRLFEALVGEARRYREERG